MAYGRELILRGVEERLSPILMTALALLPIALGGNKPGQEIEHPMAMVILGGPGDIDRAEPSPDARPLPPLLPQKRASGGPPGD